MHYGSIQHTVTAQAKVTTREFLAYCHSDVRDLFMLWEAHVEGRRLPTASAFDQNAIPDYWPHLSLVEVRQAPLRFVYRVIGAKEAKVRGRDPTGEEVATHFFGPEAEEVLASYRYVFEYRTFLFDRASYLSSDGERSDEEVLFLPLSDDGTTVSTILVYAHPRRVRGDGQPR